MSKLNVDQKTISTLLSEKKADFLIPDYQRPYAWTEDHCQTLWDDIFAFSFPDNNYEEFNENEEYFLGSIVTYRNDEGVSEVIDGQQRLTTLLLLLRAFYDKFNNMQDRKSKLTREMIEKCIWKTDTFGTADKNSLKINSEVATDQDKGEFLELLKTGQFNEASKSKYVLNYRFFKHKIDEFLDNFPSFFPYLPARILNNCILLPIEAESQDTALRIFSTLNDRGLPLSDADIFKAQFYKFYNGLGRKEEFIERWKELENITSHAFSTNSPMDELFTRYMYFLRAKEGIKRSTTEALRKFYEKNKYEYLKKEETIRNLKELAIFWNNVANQDKTIFTDKVLKKLFVLNYAPNGMWQLITSVYFLNERSTLKEEERDPDCKIDNDKFYEFLNRITYFIFAYAFTNPGLGALRAPIYEEMVNIVNNEKIAFSKFKFNENQLQTLFKTYEFTNQRGVTRSLITWFAFCFPNQNLLNIHETFQLEHIYARKRQEIENGLKNKASLEMLGNKILLEQSINIKASDYRFEDKKKIYKGGVRRGANKEPTQIAEISEIAELPKFEENEIIERTNKIINTFVSGLKEEELIA